MTKRTNDVVVIEDICLSSLLFLCVFFFHTLSHFHTDTDTDTEQTQTQAQMQTQTQKEQK